MKKILFSIWMLCLVCSAMANVTGDPVTDGFVFQGNSLANGTYVRGSANYGYDTYASAITITSGSNLEISDGAYSWLAGDTVLAVGGEFANITASQAGWSSFTGNGVNAILGAGTKLQVKFGTSEATFTTSTIAPNAGNGAGSMGTNGGAGAVQIRSSAYFTATEWAAGSGVLQNLDKVTHIDRNSTTEDAQTARLIWIWDAQAGHVSSWEILLNTSLLRRLNPSFAGPDPALGNYALMTVQQADNSFTDALVVIPEPMTIAILSIGAVAVLRKRK